MPRLCEPDAAHVAAVRAPGLRAPKPKRDGGGGCAVICCAMSILR